MPFFSAQFFAGSTSLISAAAWAFPFVPTASTVASIVGRGPLPLYQWPSTIVLISPASIHSLPRSA